MSACVLNFMVEKLIFNFAKELIRGLFNAVDPIMLRDVHGNNVKTRNQRSIPGRTGNFPISRSEFQGNFEISPWAHLINDGTPIQRQLVAQLMIIYHIVFFNN